MPMPMPHAHCSAQVEQARKVAKHWQAEAERQAKLLREAGSQEAMDQLAAAQVCVWGGGGGGGGVGGADAEGELRVEDMVATALCAPVLRMRVHTHRRAEPGPGDPAVGRCCWSRTADAGHTALRGIHPTPHLRTWVCAHASHMLECPVSLPLTHTRTPPCACRPPGARHGPAGRERGAAAARGQAGEGPGADAAGAARFTCRRTTQARRAAAWLGNAGQWAWCVEERMSRAPKRQSVPQRGGGSLKWRAHVLAPQHMHVS